MPGSPAGPAFQGAAAQKASFPKMEFFLQKGLIFRDENVILIKPSEVMAAGYARLAQLVEHLLDVQGVRDSSSLPRTMKPERLFRLFPLYLGPAS